MGNEAVPDVNILRDLSLPQGEFPGGRNQEFRVAFHPAVHAEVWKHATQETSVEICGVLVGTLKKDAHGPFVEISASIRGEAASNKFAEVTFTHETWNRINQEMDTRFADRSIVGWYHTHPNFGIFLSDRDQFICQHFFSGPGQIAHVVDPIRQQEGVFVWKGGKTVPAPWFWVGDRLLLAPAESEHVAMPAPVEAVSAVGTTPPGAPPLSPWVPAMLVFLAFATGYLLNGAMNAYVSAREDAFKTAAVLFQYGMRPGLGERLRTARQELKTLTAGYQHLSSDHLRRVDASSDSAEQKGALRKHVAAVQEAFANLEKSLQQTEANYSLTPEEEYLLVRLVETQKEREAAGQKRIEKRPSESARKASPANRGAREAEAAKPDLRKTLPENSAPEKSPPGKRSSKT